MPAQAGTQFWLFGKPKLRLGSRWFPAFAGMT
jgi:hypothetical protein